MAIVDWLREPLILAGVGAAVAIGIALWQRRRRIVAFSWIGRTSLLHVGKQLHGDLEISYRSRPIEAAEFVHLRVQNSGNLSVRGEDWVRPIVIEAGQRAQWLKVDFDDPKLIGVTSQTEAGRLTLSTPHLNRREYFEVKALVANSDEKIQVTAKLDDGEFKETSAPGRLRRTIMFTALMVVVSGFISAVVMIVWPLFPQLFGSPVVVVVLVTLVAYFVAMFARGEP